MSPNVANQKCTFKGYEPKYSKSKNLRSKALSLGVANEKSAFKGYEPKGIKSNALRPQAHA